MFISHRNQSINKLFVVLLTEQKTTCQPNPCQNYAKCITDGTECICGPGTSGKLCQGMLFNPFLPNVPF